LYNESKHNIIVLVGKANKDFRIITWGTQQLIIAQVCYSLIVVPSEHASIQVAWYTILSGGTKVLPGLIHTTSGTGRTTSGTSRGFRVKVLWKEDFPSINSVTNCISLFTSIVFWVVGLPKKTKKTAKLRHLIFTIQSYILSTVQDALMQNYLGSYMKLSNPLGSLHRKHNRQQLCVRNHPWYYLLQKWVLYDSINYFLLLECTPLILSFVSISMWMILYLSTNLVFAPINLIGSHFNAYH
jgi:hypothetical protein